MAKFCGKCGAPINENMKFCTKCGYKFENNNIKQSEPMQKVQPAVSVQPANKPEPPTEPKRKTGKTVLIIILIIAILAGIGTAGFIAYDKFWRNKSTEEDFKEALQKCSDRNMIAFYYDDYDSDGNNEAYAIMGNDGDTEKNYSNADIWFVNSDTTTQVDENVSGHTNGKISQGKTKFVSLERNTNDDNSVSDLYGVKGNKSYEPEISGQYKNVHQDGQAIVAEVIETGNEIELKINDSGDIEVGGEIEDSQNTEVETEPETTVNKSDVLKSYQDILLDVLADPSTHDISLETGNIVNNRFAIADINCDGIDELIIIIVNSSMADMKQYVWKYDSSTKDAVFWYYIGVDSTYFTNGYIKTVSSRNQTRGDTIWPYGINYLSDSGVTFAYGVSCIDKSIVESFQEEFPTADDLDNDGTIYCVTDTNSNTENLTKEEYDAFVQKYTPEDKKITFDEKDFSEENILAITNQS